jgi:hypothetical protein
LIAAWGAAQLACATRTPPPSSSASAPPAPAPTAPAPKAAGTEKGEDLDDVVAEMFLKGKKRSPGDVREATILYKWLKVGRVYWVFDWDNDRIAMVATPGGGSPPVRLTGDNVALGNFLSKQFDGRYPGASQRANIARFLKDASISPSAVIGTPEFLNAQRRSFDEWLQKREKNPEVFAKLCTGIVGREDKNEWQLQFNVFNPRGGVDLLTASGTISPLTIRELKVEVVKPRGEFSYPLEG